METGELVGYGLAALGLATIAWALWSLHAVGVDREVGNAVLRKLLAANNHERARKLCKAAPGSYFDAVAAAIEAGTASGSRDLAALEALAGPAFDAKAVAVVERWRGIIERGLLGVMLVLGGAGLALSGGALPVPHAVTSGLAVLGAAWFFYRRRAAQLSVDTARREIVPAVVKSIIDVQPEPAKPRTDDTGPFRQLGRPKPRPAQRLASLRDNECPLCGPTSTRTVERDDGKFTVLVCTGCGYTQEFADLAKLPA